jgi:A/G-specific adenine glycosylase
VTAAAPARSDLTELRHAVLQWGERERRDLPWRRTRDPWHILVSEVMLQQTQVPRVIPRYRRLIERFPTPTSCASAPVGDVLAEWSGLGYNGRAVRLHRAATAVVVEHGGRLPDSYAELVRLPGIGPYTARAILAFAFERDAAIVETNVARVLARLGHRRLTPKQVQAAADKLLPAGEAWGWNQAMLDVGARICRPSAPDCDACPLAGFCAWHRRGQPEPDPAVGSAGVSVGQSRFHGSDRQGRGRLVAALVAGPVDAAQLPAVMGWPGDAERSERVAATLVREGLVVAEDGRFRLP